MLYFATLFAIDYHHRKFASQYKVVRFFALALQISAILVAPDYESLVQTTPFVLVLLVFQIWIGVSVIVRELLNKESRKTALEFILGFTPLLATAALDLLLRFVDNTKVYPFYSIFGWQITIVIFIILLSLRFSTIYRRNEQLTNHLQEEVDDRTHELQDANYELSILNERLEKEKHRSEIDLEMASLVQKNFFPHPKTRFRGWEISICYAPQAKVSGDLYDYYSYNDTLNGLSLFDVSGHGLSASLVTMLSKNIIARLFQNGSRKGEPIDKILTKINNTIISEKGDIDNYMTGLLCRFGEIEENAVCTVEIGNAGHPYPLKFSAQDNEIYELKRNDGKKHYGAIGMEGITVSFARSNFAMATGDILILYTDGLTEATNPRFEQFGSDRIKQIIKQNHQKSTDEILSLIMERLGQFTDKKPLEDDITLIIAKRTDTAAFVSDDEHEEELDEAIEELPGESGKPAHEPMICKFG